MNTTLEDFDVGPEAQIEFFLQQCARQIVRFADSRLFLDWITQHGVELMPQLAAQIDSALHTPAQVFCALGREIWAATPLPHKKFAREHLPKPGRNDLCYCGSGRKFKQCCGQYDVANMGLPSLEMLPYLLSGLPKKRWAELPGSAIAIDSVAATAFHFLENDCAEDTVKLLEPWFAGEGRWPNRLANLFDLLLDAYDSLGKRKKRKDMARAATTRGESQVAAIGWQRLAAMLSDEGDLSGAWAALMQAQRADPDNPSLGMLEITMLLSEQRWQEAAHRARFWAARTAKLHGAEAATLEYFNMVARDPQQAVQEFNQDMIPALGQLSTLLGAAPAAACAYRLYPQDGLVGPLVPTPELQQALERWDEAFPADMPFSVEMTTANVDAWDAAEEWLPVLQTHPILWQSFSVLDDLVCALDGLPIFGLDKIQQTLIGRALTLLDCVLAEQHAEGLPLEWGFMENRPALRLVVRHIFLCQDAGDAAQARLWMERMVNQLNPNDNHGLRDLLMRDYLQSGDAIRAVALGERFTDDFGTMRYNRALAYYLAGDERQADAILSDALFEYPLIGKALLAKSAPMPKRDLITVGSKEEANLYRAEHLSLWTPAALSWLASVRKRSLTGHA